MCACARCAEKAQAAALAVWQQQTVQPAPTQTPTLAQVQVQVQAETIFKSKNKQERKRMLMRTDREITWLLVLMKINELNRSVKETAWDYMDKCAVYDLKDQVLAKILTEHPAELAVELYYVPYLRYSNVTKDRAGDLMRRDLNRHPFQYYLDQVEPSPYDTEDPYRATVEILITCAGETFSFHQPANWFTELQINLKSLPRKTWVNPIDFNHAMLTKKKAEIEALLRDDGQ